MLEKREHCSEAKRPEAEWTPGRFVADCGAVDDGYLSVNPAAKLGRSLGLGVTVRQRGEKIKAMTQEQLTAFLAAARKTILPYGPLLHTLALTGMRLGEALGLQWGDLDFEAGTVRVERSRDQLGRIDTPKAGVGRTVAMGPHLAQTLLRFRMKGPERLKRHKWTALPEWVFATRSGEPPDPQHVRQVFHQVLNAAGLPGHFTPHGLRHTFASLLLQRGEAPVWVQQQLGHASYSLRVDTYARWLPKQPIQGGVGLLEKLVSGDRAHQMATGKPDLAQNPRKLLEFLH
jgi:integrase